MKKITCVGYHDTGSGVIDDLLREFDNIASGGYGLEARFLQDPDGVSDLEFNLIQNPHRLNSGYSLKRYLIYIKKNNHTYKLLFGNKWKKLALEYVTDLADFSYQGYWSGDLWIINPIKLYCYYFKRGLNKLKPRKWRTPIQHNYFPELETFHVHLTKEEFLSKTICYTNKICKLLNPNNLEYVVLDQAVSPVNVSRYIRYFDNLKVIVVNRDPRDIYIESVSRNERVLPKDPYQFCKVYRDTRQSVDGIHNCEYAMYINFEDMIYHYDDMVKKICDFLEIDNKHHINPKEKFNPDISIKNTRLWEKFPEYSEAMKIIEKELEDYLYFSE